MMKENNKNAHHVIYIDNLKQDNGLESVKELKMAMLDGI